MSKFIENEIDGYDLTQNSNSVVTYIIDGIEYSEKEYADLIRTGYINKPPRGYSSEEIRRMSDDNILDMDYFLNE